MNSKVILLLLLLNPILPLQLFSSVYQRKYRACDEVEVMRQDGQEGRTAVFINYHHLHIFNSKSMTGIAYSPLMLF